VVLLVKLMRASANLCGSSDCVPASLVESSKFPATSEGHSDIYASTTLSSSSLECVNTLARTTDMHFIKLDCSLAQLAERPSTQPQKGHLVRTMMTKRTI
jgi:hypothetical protein